MIARRAAARRLDPSPRWIRDDSGVQTPILVCCESEEETTTHAFNGTNCTDDFVNHLNSLTLDEYGDERCVIVVFHNFKGYNGMFVLQYMYENHREVEDQICVGTKVLSMCSGNLTFKDSLCFLPFPLSAFSTTFCIDEYCKGYFPYLFNTLANQDYVGPMPDQQFYDPEGMSEEKNGSLPRMAFQKGR